MLRLIIHILSNALGILVATKLVSGLQFHGNLKWLILAGAVLGLINFFLKPIIKIISAPIIWLTLGLFTIVINIFLLNLVSKIITAFEIQTWLAAFWGVVIISSINYLVSSLIKE